MADSTCYPWFAIRVKPNFEKSVALHLRGGGYEEFLPLVQRLRHWDRNKRLTGVPLFPGYVFGRFDPLHRLPILKIPGVLHVVMSGDRPVLVENDEICAIRRIVESTAFAEPWPFVRVGDRVEVVRGPLAGINGVFVQAKGSWRVVVSVTILQRSVAVEVARECVRRLTNSGTGRRKVCR